MRLYLETLLIFALLVLASFSTGCETTVSLVKEDRVRLDKSTEEMKAFNATFQRIADQMQTLNASIDGLRTDLAETKTEAAGLGEKIESAVGELTAEIATIRRDFFGLDKKND